MRFCHASCAWILFVNVVSQGSTCLWSDVFNTCQASFTFFQTQDFPAAMHMLLQNIKTDNECVLNGCPPATCTFSDKVRHCVSLKTRWMQEMDIPLFTQLYDGVCNIFSDQNLLAGYSPCLHITNETECNEHERFCYLQPLLQRNLSSSIPLGSNPCENFRSICLPRIKISECAHCWMRSNECFRDCKPFQAHFQALQDGVFCRSAYQTEMACNHNTTCRWDNRKCDVRVGGFRRAFEDNCPLKPMFSFEGLAVKAHCESLAEYACLDDKNCRWKSGSIMENGFCPIFGKWVQLPQTGYCIVDEIVMARNMTPTRELSDAVTYFVDRVLHCRAISDKGACMSSRGSLPPTITETSANPENYLMLGIIVFSSIFGAVSFVIGISLLWRKLSPLWAEGFSLRFSLHPVLGTRRNRKIGPISINSKMDRRVNHVENRPDAMRVSAEVCDVILGEEALKPFVIDFQVATNEEEDDDEVLGNRSGKFVSMISSGKWLLRENVMELFFDICPAHPLTFLATPAFGERKWISVEENDPATFSILYPEVLPEWLSPTILSTIRDVPTIAQINYECPECFFDLYQLPVGVMKKHSKRTCPHYIHADCAKELLKEASKIGCTDARCTICGGGFTDVRQLPDLLTDPTGWFTTCDIDFSGTLDKREVEEALGAVLPLDRMKIKSVMKQKWPDWDLDRDGTISFEEFMEPEDGLRAYVVKHLGNLTKESFMAGVENVPDIETHPMQWFEYWDKDRSNTLELDELLRALVKTFCRTTWGEPIILMAREMKVVGLAMWRDLGFADDESIPFEVFIRSGGLADSVLHNEINGRYFGEGDD